MNTITTPAAVLAAAIEAAKAAAAAYEAAQAHSEAAEAEFAAADRAAYFALGYNHTLARAAADWSDVAESAAKAAYEAFKTLEAAEEAVADAWAEERAEAAIDAYNEAATPAEVAANAAIIEASFEAYTEMLEDTLENGGDWEEDEDPDTAGYIACYTPEPSEVAEAVFCELGEFYSELARELTAGGYLTEEAAEEIAISEARKASGATYEVSPAVLEAYAQEAHAAGGFVGNNVYEFTFHYLMSELTRY